jgi:hypothetical protein
MPPSLSSGVLRVNWYRRKKLSDAAGTISHVVVFSSATCQPAQADSRAGRVAKASVITLDVCKSPKQA